MPKYLHLDIVSAEKSLYTGEVLYLSASGVLGDLSIHYNHTPLLTMLKPGQLYLRQPDGRETWFFVSGGILEVQPTQVTVLANTAQRATELDEQAALEAQAKAQKLLAQAKVHKDYAEALDQLANASAQIQIINQLRRMRN